MRVIQQLSKWKHNEILKAIAEWSLYTMDFWFSSSQPNLLLLSERVASNTKGERHSFYSDSSTLLVSQKHRGGTTFTLGDFFLHDTYLKIEIIHHIQSTFDYENMRLKLQHFEKLGSEFNEHRQLKQ